MKLNVWQGLWITLAVVWFVPVAFFTVGFMPKFYYGYDPEPLRCEIALDLARAAETARTQGCVAIEEGRVIVVPLDRMCGVAKALYPDPCSKLSSEARQQVVAEMQRLYGIEVEAAVEAAENERERWLSDLAAIRVGVVLRGLWYWLAPMAVLYIFGWAVGLIMRKFKKPGWKAKS